MYALTTVGVSFCLWRVSKPDLNLTPLPANADRYIDADSAYAWILRVACMRCTGRGHYRPCLGVRFSMGSRICLLPCQVKLMEAPKRHTTGPRVRDQLRLVALCGEESEQWVEVNVRRIPHTTSRDEFVFTTLKGHDKSTDRGEWRETRYQGKKAWHYRHKGVHYFTRKKPAR